ncbi:hypothetical protein BaRGS_00016826 [Batillaria attramentaria]|uniref:Uncharacterized protein n=1 Tax=Batillaria attramentaria TaxID=370345 RepID=A0ABD0KYS3_9CAEN
MGEGFGFRFKDSSCSKPERRTCFHANRVQPVQNTQKETALPTPLFGFAGRQCACAGAVTCSMRMSRLMAVAPNFADGDDALLIVDVT